MDNKMVRVSPHTDVSVITIISQSTIGLEIWDDSNGMWLKVPYIPEAFVVNIGDCLADWSQGILKSTLHRVTDYPNSSSDVVNRYSIAYFASPCNDAIMNCPFEDSHSDIDCKTIKYSVWRKARIKRAMKILKSHVSSGPSSITSFL
jgi:isopenicillin N synthase-like dioxygenase